MTVDGLVAAWNEWELAAGRLSTSPKRPTASTLEVVAGRFNDALAEFAHERGLGPSRVLDRMRAARRERPRDPLADVFHGCGLDVRVATEALS